MNILNSLQVEIFHTLYSLQFISEISQVIKFITLLHHDFFLLCWRMSPYLVPHKTWLDTPNIRPIQTYLHPSPPTLQQQRSHYHDFLAISFFIIYNIITPIIRTRISSYYFFIDEPFFNFLHILIITSRCCLNYWEINMLH